MMRYLLLLAMIGSLAGCSTTTETGYEPRKLSDTKAAQRGYYATPFSPAAREAAENGGPRPAPSFGPRL